jgi:hypothetical protein
VKKKHPGSGCFFWNGSPRRDYFVAGAAGVFSAAGVGAGADVSAAFSSFGAMALSMQPIMEEDRVAMSATAISRESIFFILLFSSFHE